MSKKSVLKLTFEAQDQTYRPQMIQLFEDVLDSGHVNDPGATKPGRLRLRTPDGQIVLRLERGKYQIVSSGQLLFSNSPDAP